MEKKGGRNTLRDPHELCGGHTQRELGFKPSASVDLGHIANSRPPCCCCCCCVWAGRQGSRGESRACVLAHPAQRSSLFLLCISALLSSLSSATEAAGGRWWVSCSLATPAVDGDWYAALFECLSFSAEPKRGAPEQSGPYWSFPSSFSLPSHYDVGGQIFQLKKGLRLEASAVALKVLLRGLRTAVKGPQVSPAKRTCSIRPSLYRRCCQHFFMISIFTMKYFCVLHYMMVCHVNI